MKKILLILLIVSLGYAEQPVAFKTVKSAGMGGVSLGILDDENTIFSNASALANVENAKLIAPYISFETDTNTFDLITYVVNNQTQLQNGFGGITNATVDKLTNANVFLGMHLLFGYVQQDFGLGLDIPANLFVQTSSGIFIPRADVYGTGDLLFVGSFSQIFKTDIGRIDAGLTGKIIYRAKVDEKRTMLEWASLSTDPIKINYLFGFGFDLSGTYNMDKDLKLSLVLQDIFTKIGSDTVPVNVKLGVAYYPDLRIVDFMKDWKFYFEVIDLFNVEDAKYMSSFADTMAIYMKKVHIGIESNLLDFLDVRLGLSQGYPSMGAGLQLSVFNLEYAYYGKELGVFPGDMPSWNHMLALVFRY